ncbi:MAG: methylated-DNA--[protein]-cysteine S-methyltransferase [Acetobacterales bacterium]
MPDGADLPAAARDYARVAAAIRYIEATLPEQPDLAAIAGAAGLSPQHFQRLFSRWVGLSPTRFLHFLTLDFARDRLASAESVLGTALDAGLSGPGRLHDLFVTHEAMTPGEFKTQGAGLEIRYGFHPGPFGQALLLQTSRGICGLAFADDGEEDAALSDMAGRWPRATLIEDRAATAPAMGTIHAALTGLRGGPVRLLLKGTNFQIRVWEALMRLPEGAVVSYEDLAARLGRPDAVRAVAGAVGRNPISLVIPCHRVIRKGGYVSGYHWGPTRKRAMLAREAARVHGTAPATVPAQPSERPSTSNML